MKARGKPGAISSGFCTTEAAVRDGHLSSQTSTEAWHAKCRAEACACEHHDHTATPTEGATPMAEPKTTTNHTRPGGASRAAAAVREKVDENKARVDAINANSSPAPPKEEPKATPAETPKADTEPSVVFCVDGKPVGESQNKLSSISRVTATADAPRWPAPQFRAWLAEQGIADPIHSEWAATLPNGRVVSAVSKAKAAELRKAKPSAPAAKQTAAASTTERVKAEKAAAAKARAEATPAKKEAPAKKAAATKKAPAKRAAASTAKKATAAPAKKAAKSAAKEAPAAKEVEPILKESQKRAS